MPKLNCLSPSRIVSLWNMKTVNTCTYTTSFADKSHTDGKSLINNHAF